MLPTAPTFTFGREEEAKATSQAKQAKRSSERLEREGVFPRSRPRRGALVEHVGCCSRRRPECRSIDSECIDGSILLHAVRKTCVNDEN